jgi:hypothetical protein
MSNIIMATLRTSVSSEYPERGAGFFRRADLVSREASLDRVCLAGDDLCIPLRRKPSAVAVFSGKLYASELQQKFNNNRGEDLWCNKLTGLNASRESGGIRFIELLGHDPRIWNRLIRRSNRRLAEQSG